MVMPVGRKAREVVDNLKQVADKTSNSIVTIAVIAVIALIVSVVALIRSK